MAIFAVFCLVAIVNLVSAYLFKDAARKVAKVCLMPALILCYLVSAQPVFLPIIAALVFSWAGDVLLIRKDNQMFFRLGLAAFLVSHVFYGVAFMILAARVNVLALVISAVVAAVLTVVLLRLVNASVQMKAPVTAYAVVIVLMSMTALQLMLAHVGVASVIVFASSLVYIFSDTLMAYLLFHDKPKHFDVVTMVPYIIAQGGIILGLVIGNF